MEPSKNGASPKKSPEEISACVEVARRSMVPETKYISVVETGISVTLKITRQGVGPLKTRYGNFYHFNFKIDDKWKKYSAIVKADRLTDSFIPVFLESSALLLRTDSGCETGQLFGDRTCECREQLELALQHIADAGQGILISIPRQDGRGLGLSFKLATLRLQDELIVDTVQASALLDPNGDRDTRNYAGVIAVLKFLMIPVTTKMVLASNNPKKAAIFVENGWPKPVLKPVVIPPTDLTRRHLEAKRIEFGHLLPDSSAAPTAPLSAWADRLQDTIRRKNTAVCCGIDPDIQKIPDELTQGSDAEQAVRRFVHEIADATIEHVCAYKFQKAFFDLFDSGHALMRESIEIIRKLDPEVSIIIDAKVGDIDNTMNAYLAKFFDHLQADAILLNPYMGTGIWEGLERYPAKAGIVLVRTSGQGSAVIQDAVLKDGRCVWQHVLEMVVSGWHKQHNLIPVLSAMLELPQIRKQIPDDMPILVAGIGAQGGLLPRVKGLQNSSGTGIIVNSARDILYPYATTDKNWRSAVQNAARTLKEKINLACRQ